MRYRNLLLVATILSVVAGTSVYAADLPAKVYSPMSPVSVINWTGFYAGLNAGYGWASINDATTGVNSNLNGFLGGGQVGYNWQTGALVLGVEGDFQGSSQKRSTTTTIGGIAFTVDQTLPWFGTARGRIGYAAGPWLFYGTGGLAWANYQL